MEKNKTTLTVAIVADTNKMVDYYYQEFLLDNKEEILIPGRNKAVMKDGTIIEKVAISNGLRELRGRSFDQVLFCNEDGLPSDFITYLTSTLRESQVPSRYFFLYYDEEDGGSNDL